ncbi:MAG: CHASE4 domain-containing protein [Methanomassiliicoccales archaeon]
MGLRLKSLISIGTVLLVLFSIVLLAGISLIDAQMAKNQGGFELAKANEIDNNLDIESEALYINARDYSWWDATLQFVQGLKPDYLEVDLNDATYANVKIDIVLMISPQGACLHAGWYDRDNGTIENDTKGLDALLGSAALSKALRDEPVMGTLMIGTMPYLVAASSIKGSNASGDAAGVMVFGRELSRDSLDLLSRRIGCDIIVYDYNNPASIAGESVRWVDVFEADGNTTWRSFMPETASGLLLRADLQGNRSMVLEARGPDSFIQIGHQSQMFLAIAVLIIAAVFLTMTMLVMDRQVLRRIINMRDQMKFIGEEASTSIPNPGSICYTGDDEFRDMADSANYMLQRIYESEARIADSERRFRSVVQDQTDFIIRLDLDLNITFMNNAFQDFLGDEAASPTMSIARLLPVDGMDQIQEGMEGVLENGGTYEYDAVIDFPPQGKRIVHWLVRGIPGPDGIVREIQSVGRDITQQRRLQQELLDAQKLEAMGRLAGGVAHDFNNMFTSILGSLELLQRKIPRDQEAEVELQRLQRTIQKAALVSRNLLVFSRGGTVQRKRLGMRRFIHEVADVSKLGTQTFIEVDVQEGIDDIDADPGQMFQALHNLVFNAQQAMDNKGRVRIHAHHTPPPPGEAGRWVRIAVIDEGPGMTDEVKANLFKPSFTTKAEGNGIGLVIVKEIVESHRGQVAYTTLLGVGTTFEILLPSLPAAVEDVPSVEEERPTGPLHVLIMDDEPDLLEVTSELLRAEGLEVDTAADGQQALDLYEKAAQYGNPFEIVIMDLTVRGGMGGMEATRILLERDPKAKVIMSSGYSDSFHSPSSDNGGFVASMPKPYDIKDMVRLIHQVAASSR